MTELVRCPVCEGPVLYTETGAATCVAAGADHLRIHRAKQRVEAGEDLQTIINYSAGR